MPLLYLLYYHKADVTSQTFALSSQNDVSMLLVSLPGARVRRPYAPPRGDPTHKKIIIEDGVGDVILSSATCVLKVTP